MTENEYYNALYKAKNDLRHYAEERTNHKYIDRKFVNGRFVYIYPEDKPAVPSQRMAQKKMYEHKMESIRANNPVAESVGAIKAEKAKTVKENKNKKLNDKSSKPSDIDKMVDDVIRGKYGNGADRKKALGKNYDAVQKAVNDKLRGKSGGTKTNNTVKRGTTSKGLKVSIKHRKQKVNSIKSADISHGRKKAVNLISKIKYKNEVHVPN